MTWRFSVREVGDEPKEYALRSLGQLVDFVLEALFAAKSCDESYNDFLD